MSALSFVRSSVGCSVAGLAAPVVPVRSLPAGFSLSAGSPSPAPVAAPPVPPAVERVFVGGSRSLSPSLSAVAVLLAASLVRSGRPLSVGCASGADASFIFGALGAGGASLLSVFAAFGRVGEGSWRCSSVPAVSAAAASGARVVWCAGGAAGLPLASRLRSRSLAAAAGCSRAVFVLSSPSSRGSLASLASVAAAGGRAVVVGGGFAPSALPLLAVGGSWVSSSSLFGVPLPAGVWAALWSPAS